MSVALIELIGYIPLLLSRASRSINTRCLAMITVTNPKNKAIRKSLELQQNEAKILPKILKPDNHSLALTM